MNEKQTEAIRCAFALDTQAERFLIAGDRRNYGLLYTATAIIRDLAIRNQELEAMLDVVSAQRITQGAAHIEQDRKMVAAPVVLPEPAKVRKVMLAINEEQLKKAESHNTYIVGVIADKIEDGTLFDSGIYRRREIAEIVRNLLSTVTEFQVAAQETNGRLARIEKEISTAQINNHRMAASFGKMEGEPCVRISSFLATIEGFLNEVNEQQTAAPVVRPSVAGQINFVPGTSTWEQSGDSLSVRHHKAGDEPCYLYTKEQLHELLNSTGQSIPHNQEPFGYFKAENYEWIPCAETDEGAVALYTVPQPQADARDVERGGF